MAENKLLDVSKSGGLSLGTVAALLVAVLVYVAPAVAAFTRLAAVEQAQAKHLEDSATKEREIRGELVGLDKRQTRTEDRFTEIMTAIGKLERKLEDRTVYAKGRAE